MNGDFVFVLMVCDLLRPKIQMYNWELKLIRTIGQNLEIAKPFHLSKEVTCFRAIDSKYLAMSPNNITVVDADTGAKQNSIKVSGQDDFIFKSKNEIIVFNKYDKSICANL